MDKKPTIYPQGKYFYCSLHGKQVYLGRTLPLAEAKLEKVLSEAGAIVSQDQTRGVIFPNQAGGIIFSKAIDDYLKYIKVSQSPDTYYSKQLNLGIALKRWGDIPVSSVTTKMIDDWQAELLNSKQLTKNSCRTFFLTLSPMFKWLLERGDVVSNPFVKMRKIKVPKKAEPDAMSNEEFQVLLTLCEKRERVSKRDKMIFSLAFFAGLRRKEITNVKWTDVDFVRKTLTLRNAKGGKNRIVPICDQLLEALSTADQTTEYVATNEMGQKIARSTITGITQNYCDELNHIYDGKKKFSVHSLRAGFLTRMAINGVSPYIIQKLAGHEKLETTLFYCRVQEKDMFKAVNTW